MKLLVDVGNTRVKWGCLDRGNIAIGEAFLTATVCHTADLDRAWGSLPRPDGIDIANVAGVDVERALSTWIGDRWGRNVEFARSTRGACGVTNGYEDPGALGVDRWLALIGARAAAHGPVCIADCGTAVTIDLLDESGLHRGGLVAPGLRLMKGSLLAGTRVVAAEASPAGGVWGRNTETCLDSGVMRAVLGLIERALTDAEADCVLRPELLLTGGDWEIVSTRLRVPHRCDPVLVLRGLAAVTGDSG
jgi:type III pantothenate kinase